MIEILKGQSVKLYLIQRQKFLNENATYNKDGFNEEAHSLGEYIEITNFKNT